MKKNKSFICCGSRRYDNLDLDKLVDSFDFIIRHNMLTSDSGYGKKTSSVQVINAHINTFYNQKISNQEWFDIYCDEYGLSEAHILKFLDYMDNEKPEIVHFPDNNTALMQSILHKYDIDHPFRTEQTLLKTGLSFVFKFVSEEIKPFLVGYSLSPSNLGEHVFNTKAIEKLNQCHKDDLECDLIIKMHELKLIDASFCAIEDCEKIKFNNLIEPTEESIKILENIYEYSA
tara:strand:+ start:567 stop:1259 length:693 start_codon:yes stop_codon:yes gene_type:complete